jgi:hypothetical protein
MFDLAQATTDGTLGNRRAGEPFLRSFRIKRGKHL